MDKLTKLFVTSILSQRYIETNLPKTVGNLYEQSNKIIDVVNKIVDFVNSIDISKGNDGKSAYDIAVDYGFEGTVNDWIESLKSNFIITDITDDEKDWLIKEILKKIDIKLDPVILTEEEFKELERRNKVENNKIYYIGEYYDNS